MKRLKTVLYFFLLAGIAAGQVPDTLQIAPCDEATLSPFGDIFTLSRSGGILRRYQNGKLLNTYSGSRSADKFILQDPVRPVSEGADKIYVLDAANNQVLVWDRFLNLHSLTPLHQDIVSAGDFTVNSESEWLIYDDFNQVILQVFPNEHYPHPWGDRNVSGNVRLYRIDQYILLHLKDLQRLRIANNNGTTLAEYPLPDSLEIHRIFPLTLHVFGLSCDRGTYIWEPRKAYCRYLSDLPDPVFMQWEGGRYLLINRQGLVIRIP